MRRFRLKPVFFAALAAVGAAGSLMNGFRLLEDFYLRPLVRFVGYAALLAYALLKLRASRYNTPP